MLTYGIESNVKIIPLFYNKIELFLNQYIL